MKKHQSSIWALLISISSSITLAQGLYNNGARIVINNGAYVHIAGGANGNFTNQTSGASNGMVTVNGSGTMIVPGQWTNTATGSNVFTTNAGTVNLMGGNQVIGGTTPTFFNNLILSGTGAKTLQVNTTVGGGFATPASSGVLTLSDRILDLNSNRLTITNASNTAITRATGYIISETNAAVNPSIIQWNVGVNTGSYVFPFGVSGTYIPFTFQKLGTTAANISVSTRATATANNVPWAGLSNVAAVSNMNIWLNGRVDGSDPAVIDRWWDISSSINPLPGGANLTFTYRGTENTVLSSYQTGPLAAQHWNGTSWDPPVGTGTGVTSGTGTVTVPGATSFSPWVLVVSALPLPVRLLSFSAYRNPNNQAELLWKTAQETNNQGFEVEKSTDGVHFVRIGFLPAKGNTNQVYAFTDQESQQPAYYRLKQLDVNGTYEYSKTVYVELKQEHVLAIHPNPTTGQVTIVPNEELQLSSQLSVRLLAAQGNQVFLFNGSFSEANNRLNQELKDLQPGVYFLSIRGPLHVYRSKLVKL